MKLSLDDFPLIAQGGLIYAKTLSSPILTATDPEIAAQVVASLNYDNMVQRRSVLMGQTRREPE